MTLVLNQVNIEPLKKAATQLAEALPQVHSELERAGAIQYFEFSFELAWKTLKKVLTALGKQTLNNPRTIFREAADNKLIDDPELWFGFINARNKTVHTYDESTAQEIFSLLPCFNSELQKLILTLENLV